MFLNILTKKNIAKLSDQSLISKIQKEHHKLAIGELYNRYAHLMFGVALKYLKNTDEAEDIVMNIFEKIEVKIQKSNIKHLNNWLYTITKNECLMKLRKDNRLTSNLESVMILTPDESADKLEEYLQNEKKYQLLEQAIQQLKQNQKICIELFYFKNKCYDQIAKQTGFELKKVKSYIQNGKRNLKIILENEQVFK